jgi:hypothetical protein
MLPTGQPPVRYIAFMAFLRTLRTAVLSVTLTFACLLTGCSTPAPAQPQVEPPIIQSQPEPSSTADKPAEAVDIRGRVTQTHRNAQGEPPVGTVEVEGTVEPGTRYDKATIHVGHDTKIFLGRDGKPASFGVLHTGDLVEVTFTGAVAESYPVKATAARIVILEHVP